MLDCQNRLSTLAVQLERARALEQARSLTSRRCVYDVCVCVRARVHVCVQVQTLLSTLTNVHPARQKLMGLRLHPRADKRTVPGDDDLLCDCILKSDAKIIVLGTPEEHMFVDPADVDSSLLPDIVNDLEGDYDPAESVLVRDESVLVSLQRATERCEIRLLAPSRPGKRLLVLDLDYTLFDTKSHSTNMQLAVRPFLHEFLTLCYQHYDLVVWSQTRWTWLEMKLTEMGMLTNAHYRIMCTIDITVMFRMTSLVKGERRSHYVKPLEVLWAKMPQYSAANTVHVDDLSRNFALNYQSGLKIRAFKNAAESRASDRELVRLAKYLVSIATTCDDFRVLDHTIWRKIAKRLHS